MRIIKLRVLIMVAYIPTALLLAFIILSLIVYFMGWRIWVTPIPPQTPTPIFQMVT